MSFLIKPEFVEIRPPLCSDPCLLYQAHLLSFSPVTLAFFPTYSEPLHFLFPLSGCLPLPLLPNPPRASSHSCSFPSSQPHLRCPLLRRASPSTSSPCLLLFITLPCLLPPYYLSQFVNIFLLFMYCLSLSNFRLIYWLFIMSAEDFRLCLHPCPFIHPPHNLTILVKACLHYCSV